MQLEIIAVGKIKKDYLARGIDDYSQRLEKHTSLRLAEVKRENIPASLSQAEEEEIKRREGERLLSAVTEGSYLIVLDEGGSPMTSEGLAASISNLQRSRRKSISFLLGGPLGLSSQIKKEANFVFSLSQLTFPHQLARVILMEQLYRAFKIMAGEPYHR